MSSGADKIVSSILSDAQSKADVFIQDAQKESDLILEEGQKKAQAENEKILDEANKQSNMKYQQLISEAKMNARRAELEAREEVIEDAFKQAEDDLTKIASSSSDEYKKSLVEIVKEATLEVGGGEVIVHLKAEDVDKIKDSIDTIAKDVEAQTGIKTTLAIGENINTIGGAVVKTKNGEIEVNNTIESRMSRFKKSLRSEVAKVLFN
ncbi:MAG: V-type ATP synthase subunit E [Methanobacteriales archaeon HGW-Methanobacteriales-1]|jgi:V/A-type H+-transporting ATPase subunit E|nr:MAG: V-type ATP synthase subunit E [Methanobacteriales archaeon HGW-Methanobacteriales-1]